MPPGTKKGAEQSTAVWNMIEIFVETVFPILAFLGAVLSVFLLAVGLITVLRLKKYDEIRITKEKEPWGY